MDHLWQFVGLVLTPECQSSLFDQGDFFENGCLKITISKFLSLGIIMGSLVYKLPQILKIQFARNATGISSTSLLVEALSCTFTIMYNFNHGFPFSTYGEAAFVIVADLVIILQVLQFGGKGVGLVPISCFFGYLAACYMGLYGDVLSDTALQLMINAITPLIIVSRLPQIITNFRNGHTGQLAFLTWFLNTAGSAGRIFTTLAEVDDTFVLTGFLVAGSLNAIILLQILFYWKVKPPVEDVVTGVDKKAKGKRKAE